MSVYELSGSIHEPLIIYTGIDHTDVIRVWDGEEWQSTGEQFANASCRVDEAARIALRHMTSDWYADPSDERHEDDILDEIMEGLTIRQVADPEGEAA